MKENPRIVVLCSGKSALHAIQLLSLEGYLAGLFVKTTDTAVTAFLEKFAKSQKIPFHCISKKAAIPELHHWIETVKPDAAFSINFPYLIPGNTLALLPERFINFHMGTLPAYRGPMPLFEVLRAGESETELCVHHMTPGYDEGKIILREPIRIENGETFGSLALKFADRISLAAQSICQMLTFGNNLYSEEQNEEEAEYHDFPDTDETSVRWHYMTATEIIQLINAGNPWNNGADAVINGKSLKLIFGESLEIVHDQLPGTVVKVHENGSVDIACIRNEILRLRIVSDESGILPAARILTKNVSHEPVF